MTHPNHHQEFSVEEMVTNPVLGYFSYAHLPDHLKKISKSFCDLARYMIDNLPHNRERTVALRKLLESKDSAVRAALPPLTD